MDSKFCYRISTGGFMSKNDSLNTVVNTLTYLEVSSANSRLSRMEAQMNREFAQARMQAFAQQHAIDTVYALRKQFAQVEAATDAGARLRHLQCMLLLLDLSRFNVNALPDLQSREYFHNLHQQVLALKNQLAAEIGPEGEAVTRDLILLPDLIDTAKEQYVALEALNAARGAWLVGGLCTVLMLLALLTTIAGSLLPRYWDTQLANYLDGNQTYALAPMLTYGGLVVLGVFVALRLVARSGARARIRRAAKKVNAKGVLPLKGAGASKKRLASLVSEMRRLGADSNPYAYDRTTKEKMLEGLEGMEARLAAARDALHG